MIMNVDHQRRVSVFNDRSLENVNDSKSSSRTKKDQQRRRVLHFVSVAPITFG